MTGSGELVGADVDDLAVALFRLSEGQEQLCHALQELTWPLRSVGWAKASVYCAKTSNGSRAPVAPLLTKQYRDREQRIRALEIVIRNRQERPVIQQMAKLLADVRRLDSAEDIKAHVEESVTDTLTSLGYQEMGSEGDALRPASGMSPWPARWAGQAS